MIHQGYNLKMAVRQQLVTVDQLSKVLGVSRQGVNGYYGKEEFAPKDIELLNKAGLQKHVTFHSARHTFCTLLMKRKVDYKTIISAMGWDEKSGMEHILRYAHLVDENVKDAVNQLDNILL